MRLSLRFIAFLLSVLLLAATAVADGKPQAREIRTDVIQDIPETIQKVLDKAYDEWLATDGAELKTRNKYTLWRNNGEWGWCGGFITWCMLELDIPQQEKNKTPSGDVDGLVHVKEAGVGKLYDGYARMNRITRVPQKGFIAVFGNGKDFGDIGATGYYHVGLVYDVEKLSEGKYRITTIEGNVDSPGDDTHSKAVHTVRMYIRDYDLNAANAGQKDKDLSLVPEEERTQSENALFSYEYTYGNENLYFTIFLMPWIPEESTGT